MNEDVGTIRGRTTACGSEVPKCKYYRVYELKILMFSEDRRLRPVDIFDELYYTVIHHE